MQVYSITDKPITSIAENLLGIENYATALSRFILGAATPLTIGMQGEWGTGKTSLMHIVRENLEEQKVATSWVNTWEYSMFKEAHEITPAVLKGLLENLISHCKEMNYWPDEKSWQEKKARFTKGLKVVGAFATKVAVNKTTGQNIDINLDNPHSLLSEIAEIKNEIRDIAKIIVDSPQNPSSRIVFFVDDLDRIEPGTAVEILEALKNIFDIDNCVFVLAIDYDIVIKGLEKKFGKKTNENEREFRSFFDKIIQVPFSMPTGAYKIENLLKGKFDELGITLSDADYNDYVNIVKLTVGYVPRSIKRFINSFSLLKNIRVEGENYKENEQEDFCLFTLLGVQISYPHIFRLINRRNDFLNWDKSFAREIGVEEINVPDEEHEYLDEEWEQIIWCYCQKDEYLKVRVMSIIETLNYLRDKLGDQVTEIMENSMEFASMTSVDDCIESKQVKARFKAPEGRSVADLIHEVATDLKSNEILSFSGSYIHKILEQKYPGVSKGAVNAALIAYSTNHPSKKHNRRSKDKADCDWFEYLGRGQGFNFLD
ncbi:P-loop NTPase fold protein [Deltaproteobacteria bacterium IMCC39524]|nr:P-loop NTPase fold protein [Deltaproteobacteria bacterium IMCC39524]